MNLLAIASDPDLDQALVDEIRSTHPDRVTVLVLASGFAADRWAWADGPRERALRDRVALLLAQVEAHTGAIVTGVVGDSDVVADFDYDETVRAPVFALAAA